MIYILHGQDSISAKARLRELLTSFKNHQSVRLDDKKTLDDFYLTVFTKDIFDSKKVVICENFLSLGNLKVAEILAKIPQDVNVVFYESTQIPASKLLKVQKYANIENFKPPPLIFKFLDSISPSAKLSLYKLKMLDESTNTNLLWQLVNRLLLLTLAKLGFNSQSASKVAGREVVNWQWLKISKQAGKFDLLTILKIFQGAVKIDTMIKTGATNLKESTLITILLLKYLK